MRIDCVFVRDFAQELQNDDEQPSKNSPTLSAWLAQE